MYNRYIPQADGSYCRKKVPDSPQKQPPCPAPSKTPVIAESAPAASCGQGRRPAKEPQSTGSFLHKLLPGNFDTEDLIIILLLLLIAGNCREDQNFALLTLGLYLFM